MSNERSMAIPGPLCAPGQFVNLQAGRAAICAGPLSVCDWDERHPDPHLQSGGQREQSLLSEMQPGQTLDLLTGLGNGFDTVITRRTEPTV